MQRIARTIAATELLLLFPASLFMTALLVRQWGPLGLEPARTGHQIAMWYAGRQWTLPVLLIVLPLAALVFGGAMLRQPQNRSTRTVNVAAMVVAAAILVRVAVRMMGRPGSRAISRR